MDPCTLALAGGLILLGLHANQRRLQREDQRLLQDITARWRGQTGGLHTFQGVPFSVDLQAPEQARLTVRLRFPCPAALRASQSLVPTGHVLLYPQATTPRRLLLSPRTHAELLRTILARDPVLADDLAPLLLRHGALSTSALSTTLCPPPQDIRPALQELTAISSRLQEAWIAPWRSGAAALGLTVEPSPDGDGWCLRAPDLEVALHADHLFLWARCRPLVGANISARERGQTHRDHTPTGNPLLDQLLVVRGDPPESLRDPAVSGALLALLHPHAGARLEADGTLHVPLPLRLSDVQDLEMLTQVVQDVWRLQAGSAAGSPPG